MAKQNISRPLLDGTVLANRQGILATESKQSR
jgi:hypothetical protein